jgi:hypothetical protein
MYTACATLLQSLARCVRALASTTCHSTPPSTTVLRAHAVCVLTSAAHCTALAVAVCTAAGPHACALASAVCRAAPASAGAGAVRAATRPLQPVAPLHPGVVGPLHVLLPCGGTLRHVPTCAFYSTRWDCVCVCFVSHHEAVRVRLGTRTHHMFLLLVWPAVSIVCIGKLVDGEDSSGGCVGVRELADNVARFEAFFGVISASTLSIVVHNPPSICK